MSITTNRILVPTGFSDQSMIALGQAFNLAKIKGSEVVLLSVIEEPNAIEALLTDDKSHVLQQKVNEKLMEISEQYAKKYGVRVETMVAKGRVYDQILSVAEMVSANLIVMGTNGAPHGVVRRFIGSNAERVVRFSHCPVITIKGKEHKVGCDNIILPLDLERQTKEKVTYAIEYARYWNATVRVVSVLRRKDAEIKRHLLRNLNQVERFIAEAGVDCSSELINSDKGITLTESILEYEKKFQSDLIMIVTREEGSFSSQLSESAKEMIYNSEIPVMSINPREKEYTPSPLTY